MFYESHNVVICIKFQSSIMVTRGMFHLCLVQFQWYLLEALWPFEKSYSVFANGDWKWTETVPQW